MQLILNDYGLKLGKSHECLAVSKKGKVLQEIPIEDIKCVTIASPGVSITSAAISALLDQSIPMSFMNRGGRIYGKLISPSDFGDARVRTLQYQALENGKGTSLALSFLHGKLKNQSATLRYFSKSRKKKFPEKFEILDSTASAIDNDCKSLEQIEGVILSELRGNILAIEGRAAAKYWKAVSVLLPENVGFGGRIRRGATDPFNVSLNYGYGILYSQVWTCVLAAGLDPYHGFIHVYRENKPTLVFDFIEEFRQWVIDRPIISWFVKGGCPEFESDGKLAKASRDRIIEIIFKRLQSTVSYEGRQIKISDVIQSETYELVSVLKENGEHKPHIGAW